MPVLLTMPRITIEYRGAHIHCHLQQLDSVLQKLGIIGGSTGTQASSDVLSHASNAAKLSLENMHGLKLTGAATRSFGTALRCASVRSLVGDTMVRDTSLQKVLGWISAAADANRHLTVGMIDEASSMLHDLIQRSDADPALPDPDPVCSEDDTLEPSNSDGGTSTDSVTKGNDTTPAEIADVVSENIEDDRWICATNKSKIILTIQYDDTFNVSQITGSRHPSPNIVRMVS